MKKFLSLCLSVLMVCCFCVNLKTDAVSFTPDFEIKSSAGILISLDTDAVLYQKNADVQYMPGSMVQIMTAIVVLENCTDLSQPITADSALYTLFTNSEYPEDVRYADIKNGDVLTVEELLYAMMLTSSAEASVILANEFGGGSPASFVNMMNQKAQELGCENTNFTNATGLYSAAQLTTARDMAIITQYALQNDIFKRIATADSFSPATPNQDRHDASWTWSHSNTMMSSANPYYTPGVEGIKTANLSAQGRNIVTQATRDGNTFLVILMAAPFEDTAGELQYYHLEDAAALLEWAFAHFEYKTILSENTELGQIPVENGEGKNYVLVRPAKPYMALWYDMADMASIVQEVKLKDNVSAPVQEGDVLGTVTLKFSGEEIVTIDLIATSSVELSNYKYYLTLIQHFPKTPWLMKAVLISLLLCSIYIVICLYAHICYKNKLKPIEPIHLKPKASAVKREAAKKQKAQSKRRSAPNRTAPVQHQTDQETQTPTE